MGKISKERLLTGAKKAGKCISALALATTLAFAIPTTAAAQVDVQNIIGEEQVSVDRSEIKRNEAMTMHQYFTGYDYYGDPHVYPEQIRQAIELSNALNAYNNYDANAYSNTRLGEVLGLDITGMYNEYVYDSQFGGQRFGANNIGNKPAVDAYLNFSCGTISNNMKANLAQAVYTSLLNQGVNVTEYPSVRFINGKLFAMTAVDGYVTMIELKTRGFEEITNTCMALDHRYAVCFNNAAGISREYFNSFCYNGIDAVTNESAWYSNGDDELKAMLSNALDLSERMDYSLNVNVRADQMLFVYDAQELQALRDMGYSDFVLNNSYRMDATVTLDQQLVK